MNSKQECPVDYFKLFSFKKEFLLDLKELKSRQKMLLQKTHPDLFAKATDIEKKVASEFSTLVNKAYSVLKDPIKRGEHLCSLQGLEFDMENFEFKSIGFLEQQFGIREELDEIKNIRSNDKAILIKKIDDELKKNMDRINLEIDKSFKELDQKDDDSSYLLKEQLANLAFMVKACCELDEVKRSEV